MSKCYHGNSGNGPAWLSRHCWFLHLRTLLLFAKELKWQQTPPHPFSNVLGMMLVSADVVALLLPGKERSWAGAIYPTFPREEQQTYLNDVYLFLSCWVVMHSCHIIFKHYFHFILTDQL